MATVVALIELFLPPSLHTSLPPVCLCVLPIQGKVPTVFSLCLPLSLQDLLMFPELKLTL